MREYFLLGFPHQKKKKLHNFFGQVDKKKDEGGLL